MSKAGRVFAGLATMFLAASLAACSGAAGGNVATVNGQAIGKADFDAKLESSAAATSTLQQMVREALIDQYAKNNNVTISDADIAQRENDLKANFPNGSWDEMLKARGLSETDVHNALREQIIIDRAVGKDVKVTDAQIKQYFDKNHAAFDKPEQVHARHILVADLATAQKVEADLKSGKAFADEAKQFSIDPGSKDKGGDLGLFRRGQMVPAFDKAAFSMAPNVVSAPVKSPFGYHIIEVLDKQPGSKGTLASTHDRIADMLRQQQEAPLVQPFLTDLQNKATIQVSDPRFAAAFPSPAASGAPAAPAASPK
ncbi:MAG: peptidylprolyl isomerase [Candidatus Eremiobacteraeota bacterium]|nr:peptidylprolyl isomerase [Candidatus Eremiobacteraeota bacterium]